MEYNSKDNVHITSPLPLVIPSNIARVQALLDNELITESDLKPNWKEELTDLHSKGVSI